MHRKIYKKKISLAMKTKKQTKQWYVFLILLVAVVVASAQDRGYLDHRIKAGDIFYLDATGKECFIDYRQWDKDNPPGVAQGVVYYSYYGTVPYGAEGESPAWHGWIVSLNESDQICWAPENTICNDTCVAMYAVEGISTPFNPNHMPGEYAQRDTCGWQNTYRLLEFIYTKHHTTLSDQTSPPLFYVFSEYNGVSDFSEKPVMTRSSWYFPSFGQIRYLYGHWGFINAAIEACGGTRLYAANRWQSSTEVGSYNLKGIWGFFGYDDNVLSTGILKKYALNVRAVRNF